MVDGKYFKIEQLLEGKYCMKIMQAEKHKVLVLLKKVSINA